MIARCLEPIRRRPRRLAALLALAAIGLALAARSSAQTVYKCTDAQGQLSFQDSPCKRSEHEKVLHLHVPTPPPQAARPASSAAAAPPAPAAPAAVANAEGPARAYHLPQLYQCVNASNGKTYVSRNGHPRPYRAPLGIVGEFQAPLAQTYGGKDAARRAASDPQLAHGRITPGLVAGHYTLVQDRCAPMSVPEICGYLGTQLAKTQSAIDKAFKSDRPPLQAKADALRSELAGCQR